MIVKKITMLGHKDHGKSTLIGNMLILTERINPAKLQEAQRMSRALGRRFEPGFILDSFNEERVGGLTIDSTRTEKIPIGGLAIEFIDVPGHEELIKNMISGASNADIAVLVVSAKEGEGVRDQTKRHVFVARMLGINKLVVAVNKMDTVGYREERFNMIRDELEGFIEAIGFRRSDVYFVPTSAYNTDNLVSTSKRMPWYNGEPLLSLLYGNAKKEDAAGRGKELRAVLQGFIDESRTMIAGRVVSGRMRVGDRVCVLPPGLESTVKEIVVKGRRAQAAGIGESVAFRLGENVKSEVRGGALAPAAAHPPLSEVAMVRIFLTRSDLSKPMIKFNGEEVGCKSVKVLRVIDTRSGREKAGKAFKSLDAIEAELTVRRSLPFESYGKTRELGRFVLYSGNRFAGIGTVI